MHPRIRAGVAIGLATMESISLQSGRLLSNEAVVAYRSAYLAYRAGYNRLADRALELGMSRWQTRPKAHYLEHAVYETLPLNPRFLRNYLNEDFIRRMKAIASKAHPADLSRHVLFKYALQCTLRWRDQKIGSLSSLQHLSFNIAHVLCERGAG